MAKTLLSLIIVIGILLRLVNINQSFWLDEAAQAQMSSASLHDIWFNRSDDFHPPLFYFLAHLSIALTNSEHLLRVPSLVFGALSILVMYKLGTSLYNPATGIVSAFLMAINPFAIYYSQEFRGYSLVLFLGSLSMYLLHKKHWTYFLCCSLLLYTHYSSILLLFAQFGYVILFERKTLRFFLIHLFVAFILFTPWIPQFVLQVNNASQINTSLPGWNKLLSIPAIKSIPTIIFKLIAGRINLYPKYVYGIYIIFVLSVFALASLAIKKRRPFLFCSFLIPIILSIIISLKYPQTQPFRLIFILPAIILILSSACIRFPKLFLTFLVYISITGNILYFTRPRLQREQWRQALSFLSGEQAISIVKFPGKFAPYYWYSPNLPVIAATPSLPATLENISTALTSISEFKQIYLLDYLGDITDPNDLVATHLTSLGFRKLMTYNFEGVGFIHKYENSN